MLNFRVPAVAVLTAAFGAAGLASMASADGCDTYGKRALTQQKENESNKCGLSGSEWSSDLKAHMSWCAGVSPQEWQSMLQKRKQALAECKSK